MYRLTRKGVLMKKKKQEQQPKTRTCRNCYNLDGNENGLYCMVVDCCLFDHFNEQDTTCECYEEMNK